MIVGARPPGGAADPNLNRAEGGRLLLVLTGSLRTADSV